MTLVSLVLSSLPATAGFSHFWETSLFGKPLHFWINDVLMTVFFLMVGLEIEREFYNGELSTPRQAILPVFAAAGGMLVPALIHYGFNHGLPSVSGFGIPMATDIAFTLAVLSLLGNVVPLSLRVFLTALAIIDDLGAIAVIAIFYTEDFSASSLMMALGIFAVLLFLNRMRVNIPWIYLLLGAVMWYFMYSAGVHPTVTGVLVAFALPFGKGDEFSVSIRLQQKLHYPVAFIILPLFAMANTAIPVRMDDFAAVFTANGWGIMLGLVAGKPAGIFLASVAGVSLGLCSIPEGLRKAHLFWVGCLAGIGFTISIFITLLAFGDETMVNSSKIAVILASVVSAVIGYLGLKRALRGRPVLQTDQTHR